MRQINHIKSLEKPLSESAKALDSSSGLVTPVIATRAIATIDNAPIGMALLIIATIVPTKIASKCQALSLTPQE